MNWQEYSNDNQPTDYELVLFSIYEVKRVYFGFFILDNDKPYFNSIGLMENGDELVVKVSPEDVHIGWTPIEIPNDKAFPNFKKKEQEFLREKAAKTKAKVFSFSKNTP
ncbi:hypothetical protein H0A36_30305 [Endozoicomonas sp. SM1973]|uniref:Uncharacterized protein n=1 Tax=Spartinivicinus marinus TaxID=2994442 RepID=A0A853ILV3_9GAMM|nr:hypothetical protein [Spartinivicinus marinus]NYZ70307.1 hypothetical protein [Spartinivicinus marinus]